MAKQKICCGSRKRNEAMKQDLIAYKNGLIEPNNQEILNEVDEELYQEWLMESEL